MAIILSIIRLSFLLSNVYTTYKSLKPVPISTRTGAPPARALAVRKRQLKACLSVWIVWAAWSRVESFADRTIGLVVPFYSDIKTVFLLMLFLTRSIIAEPLLLHVLRPILKPYISTMDAILDLLHAIGEIIIYLLLAPSRWWKSLGDDEVEVLRRREVLLRETAPTDEFIVVAGTGSTSTVNHLSESLDYAGTSSGSARTRRGHQPPIRTSINHLDPPPPYQPSERPAHLSHPIAAGPSNGQVNPVGSPKLPGFLPSISHTYPPPATAPLISQPIQRSSSSRPQPSLPEPPALDLSQPVASTSRVSRSRPRSQIDTTSNGGSNGHSQGTQNKLSKRSSKVSVGSAASQSDNMQREPRKRIASASNLPSQAQTSSQSNAKPKLTLDTKMSADDLKHPLTNATLARRQRIAQTNSTSRDDSSTRSSGSTRSTRRGLNSGEISAISTHSSTSTGTGTSSTSSGESPVMSSVGVSPFLSIVPALGLGRKPSLPSISAGSKRSASSVPDDEDEAASDTGTEASATKKRRVNDSPFDTTVSLPPPPQPYVEPIMDKGKEKAAKTETVTSDDGYHRDESLVEEEDSWDFSLAEDEFKTPARLRRSSRLNEAQSPSLKPLLSLFEPSPPPPEKSPASQPAPLPTISVNPPNGKAQAILSSRSDASHEITFQKASASTPTYPPARAAPSVSSASFNTAPVTVGAPVAVPAPAPAAAPVTGTQVQPRPPPATSPEYWKNSAVPPIAVSRPAPRTTGIAARGMRLRSMRGK